MSAVIWVCGTILTALHYYACLFFNIILSPFDKQKKIVHAQGFWWADAFIGINPYWNLTVTGLENIDHKKTYVIVANHQSLGDIVVAYKMRMQFKWVAKESLLKIPFIGGCLVLGKHICVTRGDFGSIKRIYREAAQWLRKGMSVLFFPEGTRSDTDEISKFQNGAFKLAIKEKKPILPISISGTREAIPKGDWIFKTKVFGKLKVLPAIDTSNLETKDFTVLRDRVYTELQKAAL